jgi:hypothetical protein
VLLVVSQPWRPVNFDRLLVEKQLEYRPFAVRIIETGRFVPVLFHIPENKRKHNKELRHMVATYHNQNNLVTHNWQKMLLIAGLLFWTALTMATEARAANHYVSKNGNNADGNSYATAWNELNQINWSTIAAGDVIWLDGGSPSMTYNTDLSVPANAPSVTIMKGSQAGHSGQVIMEPATAVEKMGYPIYIASSQPCTIDGGTWRGILIHNYTGGGVVVAQPVQYTVVPVNLAHIVFENIGHEKNGGYALYALPGTTTSQTIFHNNVKDVLYQDNGSAGTATFNACWFHHHEYSKGTHNYYGIMHELATIAWPGTPPMLVENCVFGPGLDYAVWDSSVSNTKMNNCLIIDPTSFGITIGTGGFSANNVTSFVTSMSPFGTGNSCFNNGSPTLNNSPDAITNSVFYGGAVTAYAGTPNSNSQNVQYNTTGNTTFLSSSQVNPLFKTNVGALPNNVSPSTLECTDFSLSANSPAKGLGSSITSVRYLLTHY